MTTIIAGNGGAAAESIKALRRGGDTSEIHVFTNSDSPPFNPTLLTYLISGEIEYKNLFPYNDDLYDMCGAKLHSGSKLVKLDALNKTVENDAGTNMSYDNCIVCTGASPVIPKAYQEKDVFTIRSLQDALALKERISADKKALVVGASMIGVKVAEALVKQGVEVSLTDTQAHIFPLTAHADCAILIEKHISALGIQLLFGTDKLDHSLYDIIVVCVGVKPNIGFIDKSQVDTGEGIYVDRFMRTNCQNLYAAGDCAQVRDRGSGDIVVAPGLWASARYMGRTAGFNIAGKNEVCCEVVRHNITHFFGMDFVSIGDVNKGDDVFEMESGGKYCRITWKDNRIIGVNLLNMPEISGILKSQSLKCIDFSNIALSRVFSRYPLIREAFQKRGA